MNGTTTRVGRASNMLRWTVSPLGGIAVLGLATIFVTKTQGSFNLFLFNSCLLACIGAIGLNVLMGTAGLVSMGNAAFLAVGAFSTVFFIRAHVPFPVNVLGGAVISAIFGLAFGVPALRLRGLSLALATLAAHFIVVYLGNEYEGRVPGARDAGFIFPSLFLSHGLVAQQQYWAWLLFGVVSATILVSSALTRAKTGRAWRLLREHEGVAAAMGVSVVRYKLQAFVVSSFLIGLEGGLTALLSGSVTTDAFTLLLAITYIAMILIGGLDSIAGAVIGAFIIASLPILAPRWVGHIIGPSQGALKGPQIAQIVYGVLIIFFITRSPNGIVGWTRALPARAVRIRNTHPAVLRRWPIQPVEPQPTVNQKA